MVTQAEPTGRQYRIIEVVGRGGFGTVYRAEMLGAGGFSKQVAIKVLRDDSEAPPELLQRLRDEARILGLLRHRAIVGVDGLALFDLGWAVVMEYVPGVDLAGIIAGGPVPVRVALELIEEIASALHAAYAVAPTGRLEPLRLVHRDIKPSNVRLTAQGEVKVLDFGVARADFSAREAHTSTYLFGSLKYMAIERLEGVETPAADVYALGLVLAELLLGRDLPEPPRQAERFTTYMDELILDVVAVVGEGPFALPESHIAGLAHLLRTMLADNHERRPGASAVEQSCRALKLVSVGPWLREWAAVQVPQLAADLTVVNRAHDSGSILVERTGFSGEPALTPVPADDDEASNGIGNILIPGIALGGIAGSVLVGLLALAGVVHWLDDDPLPGLLSDPTPSLDDQLDAAGPADDAPPSWPLPEEEEVADAGPPVDPDPVPDTVPDPISDPVPVVQPALDPTPRSVPASEPMAEVMLTGDARSVWLISADGRFPVGQVPPGRYEIKAWFDQPEPAVAGTVTLHDGERITLRCIGAMARCVRDD